MPPSPRDLLQLVLPSMNDSCTCSWNVDGKEDARHCALNTKGSSVSCVFVDKQSIETIFFLLGECSYLWRGKKEVYYKNWTAMNFSPFVLSFTANQHKLNGTVAL